MKTNEIAVKTVPAMNDDWARAASVRFVHFPESISQINIEFNITVHAHITNMIVDFS